MPTRLFILRQRITEMLGQRERETLLSSDQISDLVHACQVLLLADLQLLVHAVGKSVAILHAGWEGLEHQVHVFHAFRVKLNVSPFVPVVQLCNDSPSWHVFDTRRDVNVNVGPGLRLFRCLADALASRSVVGRE